MEFIDYFKEREKELIDAVGEKEWRENKVYFVDEIVEIVKDWQLKVNQPKQLPLCPKIDTCKVTPQHCACDMRDKHRC